MRGEILNVTGDRKQTAIATSVLLCEGPLLRFVFLNHRLCFPNLTGIIDWQSTIGIENVPKTTG